MLNKTPDPLYKLNIFMLQHSKDWNSHFLEKGNGRVVPILATKAYKGQ
jgi:hypothetical protein